MHKNRLDFILKKDVGYFIKASINRLKTEEWIQTNVEYYEVLYQFYHKMRHIIRSFYMISTLKK